jgi:hypothetical protein
VLTVSLPAVGVNVARQPVGQQRPQHEGAPVTRTTNARIAGFALLFYIAVGVAQMILGGVTSADGTGARLALFAEHAVRVRINLLLSLLTCATAVVLGVALYGITREEDRELAVLALMFRVGEGLIAAAAPIATLGVLWLAAGAATRAPEAAEITLGGFLLKVRGWNTLLGATLFAFGSTVFSWLLLRGRMIPTALAWLGVFASVVLVVGLPLQLAGFLTGLVTQVMWLPMAAFEIPLGVWLLVRGVQPARPTAYDL